MPKDRIIVASSPLPQGGSPSTDRYLSQPTVSSRGPRGNGEGGEDSENIYAVNHKVVCRLYAVSWNKPRLSSCGNLRTYRSLVQEPAGMPYRAIRPGSCKASLPEGCHALESIHHPRAVGSLETIRFITVGRTRVVARHLPHARRRHCAV